MRTEIPLSYRTKLRTTVRSPAISIVIPFYGDGSIIAPLLNSLERCASELQALGCSIVLINDSGSRSVLDPFIDGTLERLRSIVRCEEVRNAENLGFVRSANVGLKKAIDLNHDCLLLNSDTVVFPGALSEMQAVAYSDAVIGFVNPRSNNATICSLPHQDHDSLLPPEVAHASYAALARRLERLQFVPTCVGFCMYIKHETLTSIGVLDEIYGRGYNEENDLVMRGNRAGYCAVIANRAFVYHRGGASFSDEAEHLEKKNAAILDSRYPEYRAAVNSYYTGPQYTAELLLYGLPRRGARPTIGLIPSSEGNDGNMLEALRMRFDVQKLRDATTGDTQLFAAALAVDPSREVVTAAARLAPINVFVLTGTLFFDRLGTRAEADQIWRLIARHADIVVMEDPSQFAARVGASAATVAYDASVEAIAQAIDGFMVQRVVERLSAVGSERVPESPELLDLVEAQKKRIEDLQSSFSWRVTSPLRRLHRLVSGLLGGARG